MERSDQQSRLELLKSQHNETVEFIEKLLKENTELAAQLEEKTLDYDSMKTSCRVTQRDLNSVQSTLQGIRRNSYVMVLIDGDGMIFKDNLLAMGKAGGTEAGRILLQELTNELKAEFANESMDIHVKIFANLYKLATVLQLADRVKESKQFKEFALGFTQSREHLYFIDVGDGKEMVDSRVRAELTWHLDNYNCLKVVLGASHDNGYARTLSSICSDGNAEKVLLLEGTPFASEVRSLPFQSARIPRLFESQKLEVPKYEIPKQSATKAPSSPKTMGSYVHITSKTPITQKTPGSYATAAITPTNDFTAPPALKSKPLFIGSATKKVLSPAQHQAALARLKTLQPPPCNDHYLVGQCWKDSCFFSHKHDLNAAEIQAMRNRVGLTRCEFGEGCINESCYRGHTCQSIRGGKCVRPNCPFLDSEHPPGAV